MIDNDYRLLVNKHYLVTRKLKVENLHKREKETILREINSLIGVDKVAFSDNLGDIQIQYDASKRQLSDFETVLKKYNCNFSKTKMNIIKYGWYRFVDSNIYGNALQEPIHLNELNM